MKFSIIVPVYNLERCLSDALESVVRQTWHDFECICVDDGSTDSSAEILETFAERDMRIRVIHIPNGGVSGARNRGLDEATGDWICFLDGDDVLHSRFLEFLMQGMRHCEDADLLLVGRMAFKEEVWNEPAVDAVTGVRRDIGKFVDCDSYYRVFWQGCYRRRRFGDLRLDEEIKYNMGEDNVYYCTALDRASVLLDLRAPLYGYRQRIGSAMHSVKNAEKWHYDLLHYEKCFEIFEQSAKKYDPQIIRELGMRLTEGVSESLLLLSEDDQNRFWGDLLCLYGKMRQMHIFTGWLSFVVNVCWLTKSRFAYWLFARVPRILKVSIAKHLRLERCSKGA